jgi:hypothetical protein
MKHAASGCSRQTSRKCAFFTDGHDNTKRNPSVDFTDVGNGKWLCNICKADVMTVKQAINHESSAQHSSRAEAYGLQTTSSAVRKPTSDILSSLRVEEERSHWTDLTPNLVSFWRRGLVAAEKGEEAESMHDFLDKLAEELRNSQGHWGSSPVEDDGWGWGSPAEDWTPAPDVWASAWSTPAAQVPQHVRHRREGSSSNTSMHQEGTIPERDGAHVDDNENDATPFSFVENFLQHHAVGARRRERMRTFYEVRDTFMTYNFRLLKRSLFKMPTEQKIRKIHEVISDLRGQ